MVKESFYISSRAPVSAGIPTRPSVKLGTSNNTRGEGGSERTGHLTSGSQWPKMLVLYETNDPPTFKRNVDGTKCYSICFFIKLHHSIRKVVRPLDLPAYAGNRFQRCYPDRLVPRKSSSDISNFR